MNEALIFDISKLATEKVGTIESYDFTGPAIFEEIKLKSDISGGIEIMRLEEGFDVKLDNVEATVGHECEKCLKAFTRDIKIDSCKRKFLFEVGKKPDDPNDQYLVDKNKMTIDITELLRQEIILQFPLISVCSNGCKGICPKCGKNLNEGPCDCKIDKDAGHKPLAILKDLIK